MRDSAKTMTTTLAAVFVGSALAVAALTLPEGPPAAAVTSPAGGFRTVLAVQLPDEEVVFAQQCSPCHGLEGEGGIGPSLIASTMPAVDRLQLIREGRGAMPAFQNTLDEATTLALSSLTGRLAATTTYSQQCAPCHGANGEGGIGPALVAEEGSFDVIRLVISEGEGAMPAFGPTLTDDQIDGVTYFVENLALLQTGSEMYAAFCATCHGGMGEGGVGPALAGSDIGVPAMSDVVSNGAGSMPAFSSSLSTRELTAVLAYTKRLVAGLVAPSPPGDAAPPTTEDGPELYDRLCAACHGADGEGGAGPPLEGLAQSDDQIAAIIAEGSGGMPGFGSELSSEGIDGLVFFVQSSFGETVATTSGADLYAQLCATCHGADGEGGAGPPLGQLALDVDELSALINEGKGSMPGFATQLGADDLVTLIDFLEASFGGQDPSTTTTIAVEIRSGSELYAEDCARCHLDDGSGDLGPDLRRTELSLNEIISRIYGGHAGGMPAFEGELSGLEVQEIARFVLTLDVPEGEDEGGSFWLWALLPVSLVVVGSAGVVIARRQRASRP